MQYLFLNRSENKENKIGLPPNKRYRLTPLARHDTRIDLGIAIFGLYPFGGASSNPGGSLRFPSYSDIFKYKESNRLLQRVSNIFMLWRFPLTLLRGSRDFCNIFVTSQIFSKTCVPSGLNLTFLGR